MNPTHSPGALLHPACGWFVLRCRQDMAQKGLEKPQRAGSLQVCVGVAACLPQFERVSEAQRQRDPGLPQGSFYCPGKRSQKSMEAEDPVRLRQEI